MMWTAGWTGGGLRLALAMLLLALTSACGDGSAVEPTPPGVETKPHADLPLFLDAAQTAWSYADREYQPVTGLINSVAGYPYATVWDIASGLAALYCANQLGFLPDAEYDVRMRRALLTLQTVELFDRVALHKNYSTRTGEFVGQDDRDTQVTARGYGWSAVDLGRLLIWLRIIEENQPEYRAEIRRIVERIDLARIVADGYLWGVHLNASGELQRYVEGRVGYEQYAAQGYALWGRPAMRAASLQENTFPVTVLGVPVVADRRGGDHLTSEGFILAGLEVGWNTPMRELAGRVLEVQAERYRRTGQVTMVSEDHVPLAPYYFYYYAINYHGNQFVVGAQGSDLALNEPRWVSAKAAFAWHALLPDAYTRLAVASVAPARDPVKGWSSGVYEGTAAPTGSENINTAAVILEAALFARTGTALINKN